MKNVKKILSMLMITLMLLSAWVFIVPEKADALGTVSGGHSQEHVVSNYQSTYASYAYLSDYSIPLDGSNGTPDMCVPGLSSTDDYVPQGMTYCEALNWVFISAYPREGSSSSVVYALDFSTGNFVAQFNLYRSSGVALSAHVSGIACSENNLYIADEASKISYIPVSELSVAPGTKKDVVISGTVNLSGELTGDTGTANTSYASFENGVLWTGNFFISDNHSTESYRTRANRDYGTIMLGYSISGTDSTSEWAAFSSLVGRPSYVIPLDSYGINQVQCATVCDGVAYIGTSYGRKNDSRLYVADLSSSGSIAMTVNGQSYQGYTLSNVKNYTHLPMTEGLFVKDGFMYNIFESAAWQYYGYEPNSVCPYPTDVVWKFSTQALQTNTIDYSIYGQKFVDSLVAPTVPSFNATAYHYTYAATNGYNNLAYASYNDTLVPSGDGVDMAAVHIKIFAPRYSVMVYDGQHTPCSPVVLETKTISKLNVGGDKRIYYIRSTNGQLSMQDNWKGYWDAEWTQWHSENNSNQISVYANNNSPQTQNNSKTSRFWWGKLAYTGSGNSADYYEVISSPTFHGKGQWYQNSFGSGWKDEEKDISSLGTYYVINYKPVYDKISDAQAVYNEIQSNKWKYTDESVGKAITTMYYMQLGNPNNYSYASNVGGDVQTCANYIKQAVALINDGGLNLVKKTATVKYVNESGTQQGSNYTVFFGDQVSGSLPSGPAKNYDDIYHYTFSSWNSIDWSGYHNSPSGTVINLLPNYNASEHVLNAGTVTTEPTYNSAGTCTCTCNGCAYSTADSVPALQTLINLDDVKLEDTALSGVCSIAPSVHENDISYEIAGFSATGDHTLYKSTNKPNDGTTLKLTNARIRKTSASTFSYKFSSMDFTTLESFYVLVKVSGTNLHKYSVSDVYTYEKVTLVPPKNVMFDDASPAISFNNSSAANSGYGQWVRIADSGSPVSAPAVVDDFGDLATEQQSTENSVKFSFGDAHRVSVSNTLNNNWPTAQFTFTGSGFDVISVTDSNSGVFGVTVYKNGTKVKGKVVDTYYGYTYTQLFYNQRTRKIVNSDDANGTILYAALSNTPEKDRVYGGIGTYFYTMNEECAVKDNQNNPVVAYGWLKSTSSDVMYQVPCLNMDLGEVGTYTVVIQPMFTDALGHYNESGDVKYYNFTFDGIRIYNPAGGNSEALAMYAANGETYTSYELVRETISDASLVVIDGKDQLDEQQLPGYLAGAPKNELYIKKNGTAAFDVNFTNLTDAKLGLRALNGVSSSVIISNGSSTITVPVTSATEQYYSLKDLLTSGSSSTITITNQGDGILSITRLMTTTNTAPTTPSGAPRRYLSVGPNTAQVALETVEMLNADIAIDEETIETASGDDRTVTITLQTGEDAETIVIRDADGNVVEPDSIDFTIDETGVKNWTIILTEEAEGEFTYTLQAEYENGYTGEAEPMTVNVTVSFSTTDDPSTGDPTTGDPATDDPSTDDPTTDDPTTDDPSTDEPTTDYPTTDDPSTDAPTTDDPATDDLSDDGSNPAGLSVIKGVFAKLIDFIKRIIAIFR